MTELPDWEGQLQDYLERIRAGIPSEIDLRGESWDYGFRWRLKATLGDREWTVVDAPKMNVPPSSWVAEALTKWAAEAP